MGLAEMWRFPRSCQLVAGYHHQPHALGDHRLLVALVYLADTMCALSNHGFNLTALNQKLDAGGLSDVSIDPSLIEKTRTSLPNLVSAASSFM
jgi:hypothetical protein